MAYASKSQVLDVAAAGNNRPRLVTEVGGSVVTKEGNEVVQDSPLLLDIRGGLSKHEE